MKKHSILLVVSLLLIHMLFCMSVSAETDTTTLPDGETTTTSTTTETSVETTTTTEMEGETTTTVDGAARTTTMIILEKDGKVVARLTDIWKNRVAGVTVTLRFGEVTVESAVTDANGEAIFESAFPESDVYVRCSSERTLANGVWYEAAAAAVGRPTTPTGTTTLSTVETTTTQYNYTTNHTYDTITTPSDTTEKTVVKYTAAGTTAIKDSYVAVNSAFDSLLTESFGVDEHRFANTAMLLLPQELYAQLMNGENGVLTLNAVGSAVTVTDEQITRAVAEDASLAGVDVTTVDRVVIDLSLQLQRMPDGVMTEIWNTPSGNYVIQLPLPQSMKSATAVVVSTVTVEGISQPMDAIVSGDTIRFEMSSPVGTIVVLGFEGTSFGQLTSDSLTLAIVLFVIGLLWFGGAFCLFFFVVYRPAKAEKKQKQAASKAQPTETAKEPNQEQTEHVEPVFEQCSFDEMEPAPLPTKKDNDIDIPL